MEETIYATEVAYGTGVAGRNGSLFLLQPALTMV
jgi:hypothetical protein